MRNLFVFLVILSSPVLIAQQDTIQLKEIVLTDVSLQLFSKYATKTLLNDSVIQNNANSFTNLLSQNTTIYFKENGFGMVSSPSFRGTTAQQTAVIWNGININSRFNGQTDFNTINPTGFSEITVRNGGASVLYGSGAIGGSVHLNNDINFANTLKNKLQLQYGSFNTALFHYNFQNSSKRVITKLNVTRNQSKNDYKYIGYDKKNENGNHENNSVNSVIGYQFANKNKLKFFSSINNGNRFLSGTIYTSSKSKYSNLDTRSLLEWENTSVTKLVSKFKIAYLTEHYKFFENRFNSNYNYGNASTVLLRNNMLYKWRPNMKFNTVIEFNTTTARGSNIIKSKQNIAAFSLLMSHQVWNKVSYELSLRNEVASNYRSPFLYSVSAKYTPFTIYSICTNVSRNFRAPTFNDLYWENSGNLSLKPEQSFQLEFIQDLSFKKVNFSITGYYNKVSNMLRWLPNTSGIWQPQNTNSIKILGLETTLKLKGKINKLHYNLNTSYAYTNSKNLATNKQLIYTPYHRFIHAAGLHFSNVNLVYQYNFNGKVYTTTDNKNTLNSYGFSNIYLDYTVPILANINLGFQVLNLENKAYQNVVSRPMPGRHYKLNLILNF